MNEAGKNDSAIKPTDLRGILKYVPMFRDEVFVIAVDGSLVAHENFHNVLLDIAVLRSLNIRVVLVHGIGRQLHGLAAARGVALSDAHGEGPTDAGTLELALEASALVSLEIMQGLTRNGLRCALCNGVRATAAGVARGVDQLFTGKVDKIDLDLFSSLLGSSCIPLVTPVAFDRQGGSLRVNSDLVAADLATALGASKLIYLTTQDDLVVGGERIANLPVAELDDLLDARAAEFPERLLSKARFAVHAVRGGTPRAHILDGRVFGALLNEVFDKVGVGTMVYSNDYQSIRPARPEDAHAVFTITRNAVRSESLRARGLEQVAADIEHYLVYEIDGSIVACARVEAFDGGAVVEIGSVFVQPFYQHKGVGRHMVEYACRQAGERGARRALALTTQARDFFREICGFEDGTVEDLPEPRKSDYLKNGRNSKILLKDLGA